MAVFRGLFVRKDSTRGTQPAEARKALAGLLVPSSVTGARQGILAAPGNPLQVTGTAGWQYSANAGHLASSRSDADGAVLFGNDGAALTPAVAAAPGSGSRWDLIYLRHEDVDKGGGETSAATLGVVSGVASGTPVRPTLPAGAVLVAEALVAAGATSTSHANVTITQKLPKTVARGGITPVANLGERDALAKWDGLTVWRIDLKRIEVWDVAANDWRVQGVRTVVGARGTAPSSVLAGTPAPAGATRVRQKINGIEGTSAQGGISVTFPEPFTTCVEDVTAICRDGTLGLWFNVDAVSLTSVTIRGFTPASGGGATPVGVIANLKYTVIVEGV